MLTISDDGEGMDTAVLDELNRKIQSRQTLLRNLPPTERHRAAECEPPHYDAVWAVTWLHVYSTPGPRHDVGNYTGKGSPKRR